MENKIEKIRHSLAHILAIAVLKKDSKAKIGIGPIIENGFYYDFLLSSPIKDEDLKDLQKSMKKIISGNLKFIKKEIDSKEALRLFKEEPFKLELVNELSEAGEKISIYSTGDFIDLCRGPHVSDTKEINANAFKLSSIAGAYWRGSEKNQMLTRIYGIAFETEEELEKYLLNVEEAKKRDHRKLGKELDLFHIDEEVGLGLVLWHPKGAILWRIIEDFWFNEHLKNGYELVRTPHIGNRKLWETSGHWGFYSKSMYPPMEAGQSLEDTQQKKTVEESEQYLLKPMNCPFHVRIFKNSPHSYREMPFRWAETGTVYRFEKKGELSGLTRVRGFTQDDAHIFCRKDQVKDELKKVIDFILFMYKSFGFSEESVNIYLSLRDPQNKEKYAGDDDGWNFTESILRETATEKGLKYKEETGEAAFYGPKIDFKIKDALGREWQCSTLQFDFNLPNRFDMKFKNNKGEEESPFVLHRALFGSFERFIGLLIEHYAGNFPTWLSPVQVAVLPISEKQIKYAETVTDALKKEDIRVVLDSDSETLGKKIRNAKTQKIPYLLVLGEKEATSGMVTVESKKGSEALTVEEFITKIKEEIKNRA